MFAALLVRASDFIVQVLQVPVVQQCHQHFQSVQLSSAEKRVAFPCPQPLFLEPAVPLFEPDITGFEPAPSFNVDAPDEIVAVDVISDCPNDPGGSGLWPCLGPKFDNPLFVVTVLNVDLLRSAALIAS